MKRAWLLAVVWLWAAPVAAEDLIMVRAPLGFSDAMNVLQQSARDHGYEVARVQRVDVGLKSRGYNTAEYRLVYLARGKELDAIAAAHPELLPYLPLKIVLFAEGDSSLAVTLNPEALGQLFPNTDLRLPLRRWEADLRSILEQFAQSP